MILLQMRQGASASSNKENQINANNKTIVSYNDNKMTINGLSYDLPFATYDNLSIFKTHEQFKGLINPHVIRRAPFRVFEILKPWAFNGIIVFTNKKTYKTFV